MVVGLAMVCKLTTTAAASTVVAYPRHNTERLHGFNIIMAIVALASFETVCVTNDATFS